MKIGFLITYFYPETGGAENNCYFLARELAKRHEVHVFCSGKEDKEEKIDGIHIHRSKEIFRVKYYLAFYPSIVKSLLKYNLDILHVHGLGFIQHDIAISKLLKERPETKIVCTPHGPFMALKKYNFIAESLKQMYLPILKRNLKDYDAIIQVNPSQYKWMKKEYGIPLSKIRLIPNGISASTLQKVPSKDIQEMNKKYGFEGKIVISYLGRIQKYKGLDEIIQILPKIVSKFPEAVFLAIGKDAGDKERLEEMAKELNVQDKVIFTGQVSDKNMKALLEISEIFVFPSEWEAFGIAMLEAMALGNAVISSKTEGGRYLIVDGKNGFLFDKGDIRKLLECALRLISNNDLRIKIQENNRLKSKRFLWEDIVLNLEKIYSNVAEKD